MKNEIEIRGDVAFVKLQKRSGEVEFATIDADDVKKVANYRWCESRGYCIANIGEGKNRTQLYMHRLITDNKFAVVNHINGQKLDNRKCNLREASASENACNSKKRSDNKSGYIGICCAIVNKGKNRYWRVQVTKDGKIIYKYFPYTNEGLKQAVAFRDKTKLELHGEFAKLE